MLAPVRAGRKVQPRRVGKVVVAAILAAGEYQPGRAIPDRATRFL